MAYATTDILERRWRALSPNEKETAEQLLEDAAVVLDTYAVYADDEVLSIVSCNMVRRAMDPDAFALGQQGVPGGAWQPDTPAGALEPTWTELKMLRSGSRLGFSRMADLNHV